MCANTFACWSGTRQDHGRKDEDPGWRSSSKAPGSVSAGSPAGRTPPHGDGSMYSQANSRAGKVLRPPIRALLSVIVVTEKVMWEAEWARCDECVDTPFGWKGARPRVRLESRSGEPVRNPKNISDQIQIARVRRTSS